jgi:hypothetical protein
MPLVEGETRRTPDGQSVRIESPVDRFGNVSVMFLDAAGADDYVSVIRADEIAANVPTYRAVTPWGQVTLECPADGDRRQRALWSQAAVDAYLADPSRT